MASSFAEQIPVILYVIAQLRPHAMLDIGKGFGKYGFLLHEYVGVPTDRGPDPSMSLKEQSSIAIDGVEIQPNYMWPHIDQLYRRIIMGDIGRIYGGLVGYDVVLMADVIEHLERDVALSVVKHFVADGSVVVISTPKMMFHQDLYASEWEKHRSLWAPADFKFASHLDWQAVGAGRVYVLSDRKRSIPGFGHSAVRRVRRFARLTQDLFDR